MSAQGSRARLPRVPRKTIAGRLGSTKSNGKQAAQAAVVLHVTQTAIDLALKNVGSNKHLNTVYLQLRDLMKAGRLSEAERRHAIGARVLKVRNDDAKYGKNAVKLLATLLGYESASLYNYANVADVWSLAEVRKILARKGPAEIGVCFSHLVLLAPISDERRRDELLNQALAQALSTRQLAELIKRGVPVEVQDEDDETPAVKALRTAVAGWESEVDELQRTTSRLVDHACKDPSAVMLDLLDKAAKAQRTLATKVSECAKEFETARAELSRPTMETPEILQALRKSGRREAS